jgi:type I restriction enzyme S subunit
MKHDLEIKKLGEVAKFQGGSQPPKSTFVYEATEGYIRLLQIRDFKSDEKATFIPISSKNRICETDDVLIGRYGASVGKICTGKSGAYNVALIKALPNTEIMNIKYFINYLKSILFQKPLSSVSERSAQNGFNKHDISGFPIPIPPIDEQKRIVAKLDECFEAIDKARANVERNLNNAKELFQSKLNENFSQKGDGWVEKRWGKLCQFVRGPFGGSLKKSMFKESGYVVYEQKHAIHDHFTQLRYFIDEEKFNEMKRFEVKPGDLIMSCSGVTLGKVAIIPEGIQKGIINQALLKLTPYDNVLSEFLKHWIRSKIFQDIIFKYSGGAAIPNVPSAKILKGIRVSIPNINVQKDIVREIELFESQTQTLESNYQQELDALHELKKSILQKAFNGEL